MSTAPRVEAPLGPHGVPTPRDVLACHQPELLEVRQRFFDLVAEGVVVDAFTKELLRLRSARHTDCEY